METPSESKFIHLDNKDLEEILDVLSVLKTIAKKFEHPVHEDCEFMHQSVQTVIQERKINHK